LSYGELNSISESLAGALTGAGLKPQDLVAVMLPKGSEQVADCLAVLKAGGVYVPLDPLLPDATRNAIFEQGGFYATVVAAAAQKGTPWERHLRCCVTMPSKRMSLPA